MKGYISNMSSSSVNLLVKGLLVIVLLFSLLTCDKNNVVVVLATVNTGQVTVIGVFSAELSSTIEFDGGGAITARGVCWNTIGDPIIDDSKTIDGSGIGRFNSTITGLIPNTTYYVRAYATNSLGTAYGDTEQFITLDGVPDLITKPIVDITIKSASSGGEITGDGGDPITARGVCWNTTGNPTIADDKTTDASGVGSFNSSLIGLTPNTSYYVRAYSTNSVGTVYGTVEQFSTRDGIPTLSTLSVSEITISSATSGGEITDDGGDMITARGVCWNTTGDPTVADSKTSDGNGIGAFTSAITGLTINTTYYVRSYATNSLGSTYGETMEFRTLDGIPVLTSSVITDISFHTATGGGEITENGGDAITARGVCWNTTGDPIITDNKIIDGSGLGSFTSSISGLLPNTTYFVRAYAINNISTNYGLMQEFKTRDGAATLTTAIFTDITINSATSGGEITDDGGDAITARGICWNTTGNPTITDNKTIDGSGVGSFTSSMTGLSLYSTYYVRAYSTNNYKTSYGNEVGLLVWDNSDISDIDGNTYQTVGIGSQAWMAENLKTTIYNDGTAITLITSNTEWENLSTEAYCWYGNGEGFKAEYGALYNWYTVNTGKLCPTGWHVPTDADWTVLTDYLGGEDVAGGKLKESGTTHWDSPNIGATNETGFTGIAGGIRRFDGVFLQMGTAGRWFGATDDSSTGDAYFIMLQTYNDDADMSLIYKNGGISVRCLKD